MQTNHRDDEEGRSRSPTNQRSRNVGGQDTRQSAPQRDGNRLLTSFFQSTGSRQGGPSRGSRSASHGSQRGSQHGSQRGSEHTSRHTHTSHSRTNGAHTYGAVPRAAYPPNQRESLRKDAQETLATLPALLSELGTTRQAHTAVSLDPFSLPAVDPALCPRFSRPAAIRVVNSDTINAALGLQQPRQQQEAPVHTQDVDTAMPDSASASASPAPPLIVNFASRRHAGGGWRNGALAQEEALCYRTSLALSLDEDEHYPLGREEILYTAYVLVIREDRPSGHRLLVPHIPADSLPVLSAVSVAALQRPPLRQVAAAGEGAGKKTVFAYMSDRYMTMLKMRLVLRAAARAGHRHLVLGALGCGVYANPTEEVARCWLEVLREPEFRVTDDVDGVRAERYWWQDVVFAVYDGQASQSGQMDLGTRGDGGDSGMRSNYAIFHEILDGQEV